MNETYLIAGLGNPGREYRLTRHNIGWQVLDQLAAQHKTGFYPVRQGKRCTPIIAWRKTHFISHNPPRS
jgi:PTH1 family peptidyl-tRNA hydrolase